VAGLHRRAGTAEALSGVAGPRRERLRVEPWKLVVFRLEADARLPEGVQDGPYFTVTRTPEELSVTCEQERAPEGVPVVGPFRALCVAGPLDFALVGILASLATALAAADISCLCQGTHDTDYLLVRAEELDSACRALTAAGHDIASP
jgi:hypothetical protein